MHKILKIFTLFLQDMVLYNFIQLVLSIKETCQVMSSNSNTMIRNTILREVVGAYLVRSASCSHLDVRGKPKCQSGLIQRNGKSFIMLKLGLPGTFWLAEFGPAGTSFPFHRGVLWEPSLLAADFAVDLSESGIPLQVLYAKDDLFALCYIVSKHKYEFPVNKANISGITLEEN